MVAEVELLQICQHDNSSDRYKKSTCVESPVSRYNIWASAIRWNTEQGNKTTKENVLVLINNLLLILSQCSECVSGLVQHRPSQIKQVHVQIKWDYQNLESGNP